MAHSLQLYGMADTHLIAKLGGDSKSPQSMAARPDHPALFAKIGTVNKNADPKRRVIRRNAHT